MLIAKQGNWLVRAYHSLDDHYGNLHWWPGDSSLEVIVGAILTQNTAWRNVERAIANLKDHELLSISRLQAIPETDLAKMIRASGYYNIKARRLKAFISFLHDGYRGSLDAMFNEDVPLLRERLLGITGIGPETADSILLYGGGKALFVIDAYTRRILTRHGIIGGRATYGEIQSLFMDNLPHEAPLFNQYHALIVHVGKDFCRKAPLCRKCPLNELSEGEHIDISRK